MDSTLVTGCIAITLIILIVYLLRKKFSYWEDRGIPQFEPHLIYGDFKGVGKTVHISEPLKKAYNAFKGKAPFAGVYMMMRAAAVVIDLDLAKSILIKDFQNFPDRGRFNNQRDDPLNCHLFNLNGEQWRKLRQKLSPTFTSAKIKFMYPTIMNVANNLIESFETLMKLDCHVEIKEILSRYSIDVIGTCAFGIECNSLKDSNSEFESMGKKAIYQRKHGALVENLASLFPKLAIFLRIRMLPNDVHNFFLRTIQETVEYREKNHIQRNDFMNLLMNLKISKSEDESELMDLSMQEIAAQALVFFIAGFETSSTTMGYSLYELALNQEIQDRLREEIVSCSARYNNNITFDCIKDMEYLQMVIYETLRKYPVLPFLNRLAINDYPVQNSKFIIEKGTMVFIPVQAIQNDPDIYPNPDVFDPERFTTDQVEKRQSITWIPFGDGPRNCIGLQFGKMQTSIGLALLLKNFKFTVCPQTDIPLKFGKKNVLIYHDGDIVLKVEKV